MDPSLDVNVGVRRMTRVILLETIRDLNKRIDDEIAYYNEMLDRTNTRLTILNEERRQLLELLQILEKEKNK